ncbi:hypothetical protein ACIOKD_16610 [Streptomyces sp. NPDC087844]|uniref:phage tail protein n=1 Tax=Streptomyces sp. NPDC087844 TaxID=3365805 RepID=UPI00382A1E5A
MALNLGELVAGLRADDAPFTRALNRAELRMRGLTRDVNGQLRDLHGRFVRDSDAMGRSLSFGIGNGARGAISALRSVGKAAMVMAAVSSLAAVGAAGALAALPLAVIAGGAAILASNKEVAGAFSGLAEHVKGELTKLAQPLVKPFVQAAAQLRKIFDEIAPHIGAAFAAVAPMIGPLVDGIGKFATGLMPGFVAAIESAQPVIEALASGLGSIGAGLGGFFEGISGGAGGAAAGLGPFLDAVGSLLPVVGSLIGSLAELGGPILAGFVAALEPLVALAAQAAEKLREMTEGVSPSVLHGIGGGILGLVVALKLYSAGVAIAGAASRLMGTRLVTLARTWVTTAATAVGAQLRIAASATANAARTAAVWAASAARMAATWLVQMIRVAAVTVAQFVMMAARAVVWAATMAAQWLIAMGPIGWIILAVIALVALIVLYWDQIKAATLAVWDWIVQKLVWAKDMMISAFMNFTLIGLIIKHWATIRAKTSAAWDAIMAWIRKIPGWIYNAFLNWTALGLLIKHWSAMKTATINKATELINWVKGIPGRVKSALGNLGNVLLGAGRALIQGFINGIKNMLGSVRNAASSVVSAARDYFPFSPAKKGPFSGRGYTTYSGLAMMTDWRKGIEAGAPGVQSALASVQGLAASRFGGLPIAGASVDSLVSTPAPITPYAGAGTPVAEAKSSTRTHRVELDGPMGDALIGILRSKIGHMGGDVQLVLGSFGRGSR